jgi:Spy/CpxP family protein refolding chaperone
MKKFLILMSLLMGVLVGVQSVCAQPTEDQSSGKSKGQNDGKKRMQWLQELNLTDEQKIQR